MESLSETSDATLVVMVARGSQGAVAEVYRRHSGPVLALARRLLRNPALAEDVVQEVFVRLWNAPEKYDAQRGGLRSYLLAQSHGRSIDMLRSETSRRRREETDATRTPSTTTTSVEDEVWRGAVSDHVQAALETLDTDERRAIELAYFGGHTYREAAAILGQPEGTVKSRIRKGMQRMRSALTQAGLESP